MEYKILDETKNVLAEFRAECDRDMCFDLLAETYDDCKFFKD